MTLPMLPRSQTSTDKNVATTNGTGLTNHLQFSHRHGGNSTATMLGAPSLFVDGEKWGPFRAVEPKGFSELMSIPPIPPRNPMTYPPVWGGKNFLKKKSGLGHEMPRSLESQVASKSQNCYCLLVTLIFKKNQSNSVFLHPFASG